MSNIKDVLGFHGYTFDALYALRGNQFEVSDGQRNHVTLTLLDVKKGVLDNEYWDAFTVIYKGDRSFRIPQGTYQFHHEKFGSLGLFLSPKSEVEYEVVVTRRKQCPLSEATL